MPSAPAPAARPAGRAGPSPWWILAPLLLAAAATWRALPGEFQFDDQALVLENPAVRDLGAFLGPGPWRAGAGVGRPGLELTFALNHAFGGFEPWNFHLTNLAIHLAAVLLAWSVARHLLRLAGAARADGVALAAAGLFALHPLQSEAVSYVWQRGESLAALLFLVGLRALLASDVHATRRRRWALVAGGLLAFLLGLTVKPTILTLPAAWLLLAWLVPSPAARPGQVPWRARRLPAALLLALATAFGVRLLSGLHGPDVGPGTGISPWAYLLTQARVLPTYLRLLAWPTGQSVDWRLAPQPLLEGPTALLSGLLVLATLGGALRLALLARGREDAGGAAARVAGAGLLWFFLLLAPTSTVVPIADLLVEHRVYLPSLGIFLALAVVAERLLAHRSPPWLAPTLVAGTWLTLAGLLHARNAAWETRRALWGDVVAKDPGNARAFANLGAAASQEGRPAEALGHLERALSLLGDDPEARARVLANLGIEQARLGRLEAAEGSLRAAGALRRWPSTLDALAAVLLQRGALDEAEGLLRELLAARPGDVEALTSLGQARLLRGDGAGALGLLEAAAAIDPRAPEPGYFRARALARLGRRAEACAALDGLPGVLPGPLAAGVAASRRELGCGRRP